jgi:hypothetical protein
MKKLFAGCALALAMFAVAPGLSAREPMPLTNGAVALAVTNVAQPSAALATVAIADAAAVSLTAREMQQVHGSGWFHRLVNAIKHVYQWIISPQGQKILKALWDIIQQLLNSTQTTTNFTQTDTYSNTTQSNEYYDDAGNLVGSDESGTGDVFEGSSITYDNGGGDVQQLMP